MMVRYQFAAALPIDEIEGTLFLALLGCESLHGKVAVRLQPCHRFDRLQRRCEIDVAGRIGCDLEKLFRGFVEHEYQRDAVTVESTERRR